MKTFYEEIIELFSKKNSANAHYFVNLRISKHFMNQKYAENIQLYDIANAAHMSCYHYIRIFQRVYGITPRKYLRDLRISKAKELLKQGVPVTTACLSVGYTSLPTFSLVFKKGTGTSPKNYQKYSNLE